MDQAAFTEYASKRFPSFDAALEYKIYDQFALQAAKDNHISRGEGLRVLVLSDSCPGYTLGLIEYLSSSTEFSQILLRHDINGVVAAVNKQVPDIFLFVGHQIKHSNYLARYLMIKRNPFALVAMVAELDDVTHQESNHHQISYLYPFSTTMSLADFVDELLDTYAENITFEQKLRSR